MEFSTTQFWNSCLNYFQKTKLFHETDSHRVGDRKPFLQNSLLTRILPPHHSSLTHILPFVQHFSINEKKETKGGRKGERKKTRKKGKKEPTCIK